MELRSDQWRLIQTAIRRYQLEKCLNNTTEYSKCSAILDEIFDLCYDQRREQPT
jgi:hypothetical protein